MTTTSNDPIIPSHEDRIANLHKQLELKKLEFEVQSLQTNIMKAKAEETHATSLIAQILKPQSPAASAPEAQQFGKNVSNAVKPV